MGSCLGEKVQYKVTQKTQGDMRRTNVFIFTVRKVLLVYAYILENKIVHFKCSVDFMSVTFQLELGCFFKSSKNYFGGIDWEDHSSRPTQAKS
jgi:hypothetical protein